jgi:putative Mg2+ transporter-C (MgtC) family protein
MISELTYTDILLRIGLSLLAGLVLGFERESHGRAAGLRTTMLICVAACLAMLISEMVYVSGDPSINWRPDPARLAAGVLTGMGFVGAGTIIREGYTIRGVTTAAVLWYVTMLGLAFGAGYIFVGMAGFAVALISLLILPYVESSIENDWYAKVNITTQLDGISNSQIKAKIEELGITVKSMELSYDRLHGNRTARCELKFKRADRKHDVCALSEEVVEHLFKQEGVTHVEWR